MCLSPISKTYHYAGRSIVRHFACGKCIECLKQKQNDYAVGALRTAKHYGFDLVEFVTLTYRPSSIPVMRTDYQVDENGEMNVISQGIVPDRKKICKSYFIKDTDFLKSEYLKYNSDKKYGLSRGSIGQCASIMPRWFSSKVSKKCDEFSVLGQNIYSEYCHSLCRKDLRLSLKRGRVQYLRDFGCNLPEFKYLAVGEYGKKGRPHYHLLIFGLSHMDTVALFRDWKKRYGYVYIKHVVPKSKGDSAVDAVEKTCRYVSKYITKGSLDDSKVISKVAEKPRKMASLDFGFWNPTDKEESWYLGYDIVGHPYNVDSLEGITNSQMIELIPRINDRMSVYYGDNGSRYIFPKPLKHRLIHKYEIVRHGTLSSSKVSCRYSSQYLERGKIVMRASSLSAILSAFVFNNSYKDFMQRIRTLEGSSPGKDPLSLVRELQAGQELPRLERAKTYEKNLLEQYNTSVFD